MRYANGKDVLPPELLAEVQKHLEGEILYIPKKDGENRVPWGQLSGYREQMKSRNNSIIAAYRQGSTINNLMEEFCLSESSIRKIIYSRFS